MQRQFLAAGGAVLAIFPMAASAQDDPSISPAGPSLEAGPRAELVAAYEESGSDSGFLYGIRLGYDFSLARNVTLGLEGEAANSTLDTHSTVNVGSDIVTVDADFGRILYAGGRIAFGVTPRVSIFGRAGYVNRRVSGRIEIFETAPSGAVTQIVDQRFQSFHDGFRVGVGAQARLAGSLYGGVEYRFEHYGGALADGHQTALTLGLRF